MRLSHGAKMDRDLLERGQISWEEACYLLSICNHPSPMFLTGYTVMEGQKLLPPSIKFPLFPFLAALYLPVFPISYLARHYYDKKSKKNRKIRPSVWSGVSHTAPISSFSLDEHLMSCLETMEKSGFISCCFPSYPCIFLSCPFPALLF